MDYDIMFEVLTKENLNLLRSLKSFCNNHYKFRHQISEENVYVIKKGIF